MVEFFIVFVHLMLKSICMNACDVDNAHTHTQTNEQEIEMLSHFRKQ